MNKFVTYIQSGQIFVPVILAVLAFLFNTCNEEALIPPKPTDALQIGEYIGSDPDNFSEFNAMVEQTQTRGLLNSRGPMTLFLPDNDAIFEYYREKGISSSSDIDPEALKELVLNHIVLTELRSDVPFGSLPEINAIGDYIASGYDGIDVVLNHTAKIIDENIDNQNGYTHVIDHVLEPFDKTVYEKIASLEGYGIFAEALDITGIKDTLNVISVPFGDREIRNRYTILAVHDSIFQSHGINNIDQLIEKYAGDDNNITSNENGFYQFVEYHCIVRKIFLNDFPEEQENYPDLSEEKYISFQATDDYMINLNIDEDIYTSVYQENSNIPAKNGVIHPIDGLLPVVIPEPIEIRWETTDHFDIVHEEFFRAGWHRWTDGENDLVNVKWIGDYLLYYYSPGWHAAPTHADCLSMNGVFDLTVTTPKIPKGEYMVSVRVNRQVRNAPNMRAYLDGVRCDTIILARADPSGFHDLPFKHVKWTKTERHTLRLKSMNFGMLFFDQIVFTPIELWKDE